MQKLSVDLENCYGINKLEHNFDFSNDTRSLIYASNGTMKTSFAKTFNDISQKKEPKDNIFDKKPVFDIQITNKDSIRRNIEKADIFVIESFFDDIDFGNLSLLLANKELKNRFSKVYNDIEASKKILLAKLANLSGLKKAQVETTLLNDLNENEDFLETLSLLENKIGGKVKFPVEEIQYKVLFDEKVLNFIKEDIKLIESYAEKYNELVDKSPIFRKNIFTHNDAFDVGKQLHGSGFFDAEHQVSLKTGTIIANQKELEKIIQNEKEKILTQEELNDWFNKIDSNLNKNKPLKEFKETIGNHQAIISELKDVPQLKKEIWISILNLEKDAYNNLIDIYRESKDEIENIRIEAKAEETDWKEVVDLFNNRFEVPFKIEVSNQDNVILESEIPTVTFKYEEKNQIPKYLLQKELEDVLSAGEKRALYLLNILYEIEIRKKKGKPTLIIADDIADSFDYQNKYAIIEYLNDISKGDMFRLIILTHNFDFYRTVGQRLDIKRNNCYMVIKNENEIKLVIGQYQRNVFSQWKRNLNGNNSIIIASIPFVRNLIEYTNGKNRDYHKLTKLLHLKDKTKSIRLSELKQIYLKIWKVDFEIDNDSFVFDAIIQEADKIIKDTNESVNLEKKIVLSIAIRLLAEEYMVSKIQFKKNTIYKSSQTRKLYERFKAENDDDPLLRNLEQVNLMTPENIHLNSFMYEPILDMSDGHLRKLYIIIKNTNTDISNRRVGRINKTIQSQLNV